MGNTHDATIKNYPIVVVSPILLGLFELIHPQAFRTFHFRAYLGHFFSSPLRQPNCSSSHNLLLHLRHWSRRWTPQITDLIPYWGNNNFHVLFHRREKGKEIRIKNWRRNKISHKNTCVVDGRVICESGLFIPSLKPLYKFIIWTEAGPGVGWISSRCTHHVLENIKLLTSYGWNSVQEEQEDMQEGE